MSELTVASRYAKSLIDLAQEQKALEEIKNDMELFVNTLRANHELQAVLRNPIVPQDKKVKILESIFSNKVHKATGAFFNIMINKGRAEILYGTAKEFINQYDILKHIVKARIVSASPLSEINKAELVADIKAATGGNIQLETKVNPKLIGGFILTIGDKQVDTSISGSLNRLKQDFAQRVNR